VNPLPINLCANLISDKHWFSENVLCLLSNAVKYSDGGTVTVSIELLEVIVNDIELSRGVIEVMNEYKEDVRRSSTVQSIRVNIEDTGINFYIDLFIYMHIYVYV
jgi:signal transduction histidine kinase